MKIVKWIFIIFNVVVFSMLIISNTHAAGKMPTKLIYKTFFPETDIQHHLCETWAKEIEKRTHGQLKIDLYSGGIFLHGDQIYEGLVLESRDIGMSAFAYDYGQFPVMTTIDYSIGFPSGKVAIAVINEFYKKYQTNELSDVKILYLHAQGPGLLHSKILINKLEDL
jgi:TRAP-type C4-dicarboxylate transport system substrate-binding protein